MDKQQLVEKATEAFRPFETENVIQALQNLSFKHLLAHPVVLILIIAVALFGVAKRSKPILLSLFSLFGIAVIIHYAMPSPGNDLSLSSTLPFVGGGLLIGLVVIYYSLIKSD